MKRFLRRSLPVIGGFAGLVLLSASASAVTVVSTIVAGSDDAEEAIVPDDATADTVINSSDLELHSDGPPDDRQWVGMRFINLGIPQGAQITGASIQFTADNTDGAAPTLDVRVHGELATNSATFVAGTGNANITSRPRTSSSVVWSDIPLWDMVGEAGLDQRTPDLASIIQELVNQPGWMVSSPVTLLIEPIGGPTVATGADERTAGSFETDVVGGAPPVLTIEYIPEPASLALLAMGGIGLTLLRRRRG